MKSRTPLFTSLFLGLAIALSATGYAEAKDSEPSKHVVKQSSKKVAANNKATATKKANASKKSAKTDKVATKANKKDKDAGKNSKSVLAKKSTKASKNIVQKSTSKTDRIALRKEKARAKLAKVSRTGKIAKAAKYAAKPVIIASAATVASVAAANHAPISIEQTPNATMALNVESKAALVMNAVTGEVLYAKNTNQSMPIASITKLMTVMVVLDAKLPLDEPITISDADIDRMRNTTSRLTVGAVLSRAELMLLALMSSENRAAAALARTYTGGTAAAIAAMNRKAVAIGMTNSRFYDGTGLSSGNVASPKDLATMVKASTTYPLIRRFSTTSEHALTVKDRIQQFHNTNYLVKSPDWDIGVSKTGFINEAGKCLVMQAKIKSTPVVIVLMDSWGKYTRIGDAQRVKKWLEAVPAG